MSEINHANQVNRIAARRTAPRAQPRVMNKLDPKTPLGATDIGPGTPWANPFLVRVDGKHDEVCDQFDLWARNAPDVAARWIRDHIDLLIGKDLSCYCAPLRCHGDTLLEMAAERAGDNQRAQQHKTRAGHQGHQWVRINVPGRRGFEIEVSSLAPDGRVLSSPAELGWMLGRSCSEIAARVRRAGGSTARIDLPSQPSQPIEQVSSNDSLRAVC